MNPSAKQQGFFATAFIAAFGRARRPYSLLGAAMSFHERESSGTSSQGVRKGSFLREGSVLSRMRRRKSPQEEAPALGLPPEAVFPATFTRADLKPKGVDRLVIHPDNRVTRVPVSNRRVPTRVISHIALHVCAAHGCGRGTHIVVPLQIKGYYEIVIIFCVLYTAIVEPVKARSRRPFAVPCNPTHDCTPCRTAQAPIVPHPVAPMGGVAGGIRD